MRRLLATLLATTVLAGCAGSATPDPGSAPPAVESAAPETTTSEAAPEPTTPAPLSKPEAAKRYLAIVEPYNVAVEKLEQAINSGQPVATLRAHAAELADANRKQLDDLKAAAWPPEIRAAMTDLIEDSEKAQPFLREAAEAEATEPLVQAVVDSMEYDGGTAATAIRTALDLDKYDETEYGGS